jgi:hypothetical protein
MPMLGLDTDDGSEFINDHRLRLCRETHITFTHSRPYRKNDNCFVEPKNNSVEGGLEGEAAARRTVHAFPANDDPS